MSRTWQRITLAALVLSVSGAVRAPAGVVLVTSKTAPASKIVFGIETPPTFQGDFAINSLLINTLGAVPEPASLVLAAIAIPAVIGLWLRRRK